MVLSLTTALLLALLIALLGRLLLHLLRRPPGFPPGPPALPLLGSLPLLPGTGAEKLVSPYMQSFGPVTGYYAGAYPVCGLLVQCAVWLYNVIGKLTHSINPR